MKTLALRKKILYTSRSRKVTLHPHQLDAVGVEIGEEVLVYVKGKKIIIEKINKEG